MLLCSGGNLFAGNFSRLRIQNIVCADEESLCSSEFKVHVQAHRQMIFVVGYIKFHEFHVFSRIFVFFYIREYECAICST